jgi:hypothetical protein
MSATRSSQNQRIMDAADRLYWKNFEAAGIKIPSYASFRIRA